MTKLPRWCWIVTAAFAPAGCVHPAPVPAGPPRQPLDWRSLVGCYTWEGRHYALDSIPTMVVFAEVDGARLARSTIDWSRGDDTYWTIAPGDSVKLSFGYPMYEAVYRLAVRGESLVGHREIFTDIAGDRPKGVKAALVREPCPRPEEFHPAIPDSAAQALLFGYAAVRPSQAQLAADPWRAVAPLRAWIEAHPPALRDFAMRIDVHRIFERAASADVRANARDLVGTYRLEIQRTGGPTRVFWLRTEIQPWYALRPPDTATIIQERPSGYRLRFAIAGDTASLPMPSARGSIRKAYGSISQFDVRLPPTQGADGTTRWRGSVALSDFGFAFREGDRELTAWGQEWFRQNFRNDAGPVIAEFVLWPDGRATFTQREELAPDRVITLRGERISSDAWQCTGSAC